MGRILRVQLEGMSERFIAVGDNRFSLRKEVADTIDGFSENRREIAGPIVRNKRVTEIKKHRPYRVAHRLHHAAQRIGVQRPATPLTGSDPVDTVCRQAAPRVN